MYPAIDFKLFQLPLYSTIFIIGFIFAIFIARRVAYKYNMPKEDVLYASIYASLGLFAGAKIVFFISKLPKIIPNFDAYIELWKLDFDKALNYSFGGLVFYGGLIGGIVGVYIYCRKFKMSYKAFLDIYAPLIPLVHGFGRIGCFFAGCCYGVEYHGFGAVKYPYNELMPELDDVTRVPVQLIEAFVNFAFTFILLFMTRRHKFKPGQTMGIYLLYYTVFRVLTEMLRGDTIRGSVGGISTSQIISIILFPIALILVSGKFIKDDTKQEANDNKSNNSNP